MNNLLLAYLSKLTIHSNQDFEDPLFLIFSLSGSCRSEMLDQKGVMVNDLTVNEIDWSTQSIENQMILKGWIRGELKIHLSVVSISEWESTDQFGLLDYASTIYFAEHRFRNQPFMELVAKGQVDYEGSKTGCDDLRIPIHRYDSPRNKKGSTMGCMELNIQLIDEGKLAS